MGSTIGNVGSWVGSQLGAGGGGDINWLGGLTTDIGNLWQPAVSFGASALSQSQQNKALREMQKENQRYWQQTAYPNVAAVNASTSQAQADIAQQALAAKQNLMSNAAARGFFSGSGETVRGLSNIQRGVSQAKANVANKATQLKFTPQWGPPAGAYSTPQISPWGAGVNTLGTYLGYLQAMNWLKNMYGSRNQNFPMIGSNMNPNNYWGWFGYEGE